MAVLQQENQLLQNQVEPEEKEKDIQESNEIKKYKSKIKQLEEKLGEKNEEMEEMLMKLKPLLKKDRSSLAESRKEERGDSKRASLSMLEVFLTKYKISMFWKMSLFCINMKFNCSISICFNGFKERITKKNSKWKFACSQTQYRWG